MKKREVNTMIIKNLGVKCGAVIMMFAGVFLAGCATAPTRVYTGPELPEAQLAKISVDLKTPPPAYSGRTKDEATIRALDGQKIKVSAWRAYPMKILVLPGRHEVLARVEMGMSPVGGVIGGVASSKMENAVKKWDAPLIFNAEAGKTYMIRFEFVKGPESPSKEEFFNRNKGKLWVYWIEEEQSGKFICGWRPDEFNR